MLWFLWCFRPCVTFLSSTGNSCGLASVYGIWLRSCQTSIFSRVPVSGILSLPLGFLCDVPQGRVLVSAV